MAFNGVVGANCINKMMLKALLNGLPEDYNDIQGTVLADTLEKLPDCSKIMDEGQKPLEPGKMISNDGNLVEVPKKQRKLSKYQVFMSQCAKKENGTSFSECAIKWQEFKNSNK